MEQSRPSDVGIAGTRFASFDDGRNDRNSFGVSWAADFLPSDDNLNKLTGRLEKDDHNARCSNNT